MSREMQIGRVVLPSTVRVIWPEESVTYAQIARERAEARADWLLLKRIRKMLGLARGESLTGAIEQLIRSAKGQSLRARPTRSPVRRAAAQARSRQDFVEAWAQHLQRPAKRKAR